MGRNNITLDRDRAFDINTLNELLTQGKAILTEAISIKQNMYTAIKSISETYNEIDPEYRVSELGEDIPPLLYELAKDSYQDTIDRLDTILNKLMSEIPAIDTSMAQSMDSNRELLNTVRSRIGGLKEMLEAGDINLGYEDFKTRLEDIKAGWDMTTEDMADLFNEINGDMLGVNVQAVQYSSDPVNLSTGNFIYDHEDIKIGGEIPLSFHRYYNAKDSVKGSMGRCWRHNNEAKIKENTEKGKITINMGDGQKKTYRINPDGSCQGQNSATETLTKTADGYHLETLNQTKHIFDQSGRIIRTENKNRRGKTYTYNEKEQLQKVETDNGASLKYSYNTEGQLQKVTDHTGRTVELTYERKKLIAVTTPQGSIYKYQYGKNGRIEEVKNPRGNRAVKNTYDDKRRITHQEFADGGSMKFDYDDTKRQVILTERNQSKITYIHDNKYRNTETIYPDGTREKYEYNAKNQRTLYVDRNGNQTKMSYDDRGNITQIINALGEKTNLTYNAFNKLTNIKVNGKEKLHNKYDAKGNLTTSIGADCYENQITYDSQGRPLEIKAPDQSITKLIYDERGNITKVIENDQTTIQYKYDSLNRVTATTDGNKNTTRYTYNKADKIIRVENPLGSIRTYSYNESGKITKITDYDEYVIKAEYNEIGKISRVTDKEGQSTRYTYDKMWEISEITHADGGTIKNKYDQNNRLIEQTLPEGGIISCTYDPNGNITTKTDAEGNVTKYQYDALNRIKSKTDPAGSKTEYTYDQEGNITCKTDALGNKTTYTYDEMGRCTSKTNVMGQTTTFNYDALGHVTKIKKPNGTTEERKYKNGRLAERKKADGSLMKYTYDGNGNCTIMENGQGQKIHITYDVLNRAKTVTNPDGGTLSYEYDAMGNITKMTDALGNETSYTYTPNGNLKAVTDALGNKTTYTYDKMNRLNKVERVGENNIFEQKNQVTIYEWNNEGQIIQTIDPLGAIEKYAYDKNGKMTTKTDKDGNQTTYTYDSRGLITDIQYADGTNVAYTYDALRRLEEIKDSTGVTKIKNDALGRVTSVTDPQGKTIGYEWGNANEKKKIIYPDGKEAKYNHNPLGQLEELTTAKGTTKYTYDKSGRLTKKELPNKTTTSYSYNKTGRLEKMSHIGDAITEEYKYQYDKAGNKTGIEKTRQGIEADSGIYGYGYDSLTRLTEVIKDGNVLRKYKYDAFGNRIQKEDYSSNGVLQTTYQYNQNNQLIHKTDNEEQTYTYDKRGNLTEVKNGDDLINAFTFDAANRMITAAEIKDGIKRLADYQYNGIGQRIGQSIYETKETSMSHSILQMPQTPQISYTLDITRQYNNLLMTEDKSASKEQTYYWDTNIVALEEENEELYYLQDDLGSPMQLIDESGEIKETYGYDEYGCTIPPETNNNFMQAKPKPTIQPYGYTGYQKDEVGGLYYAQARRYDAGAGRFTSEDKIRGSIEIPITLNRYQYCKNHPLTYIDPNGKDYIIIWSYGKDDVEPYEERYSSSSTSACPTDAGYVDNIHDIELDFDGTTTNDWTTEMWDDFDERCPYARAAYTRRDELLKMGVPADEIHVIRVDGSEDLVDKWNTFVEYDSVQSLEFYTHGTSGHIEPYGGINDSIFTDGTLGNLNWKKDKNGRAPQIVMYGCHTAGESGNKSNTTQNIANYFGVEVHGNMLNTSFSKEKTVFKRIDEWTTSNDVYLATYGTYDDKSFWFNEDQAFSYLYQRFCGKVLGRDRCPMTTFYPKCSE